MLVEQVVLHRDGIKGQNDHDLRDAQKQHQQVGEDLVVEELEAAEGIGAGGREEQSAAHAEACVDQAVEEVFAHVALGPGIDVVFKMQAALKHLVGEDLLGRGEGRGNDPAQQRHLKEHPQDQNNVAGKQSGFFFHIQRLDILLRFSFLAHR